MLKLMLGPVKQEDQIGKTCLQGPEFEGWNLDNASTYLALEGDFQDLASTLFKFVIRNMKV